jgi:hypothetical protein
VGLCLVAMPACTTGSGTHYCLLRLPAYRTQLHHPAAMDLGDLSRHPAQIVGCTVHPPTTLSRGGSAGTGTRTGSPESTHKKKSAAPLVAEAHILQNPWLRPPGLVPPPCDDGSEAGPAGSRFSGGGGRWAPRRAAQPVTRTPAVGGVAISGHGTTRSDPTGAQTGPGIAIFPDRTGLDHAMQVQMQRA